MNEPSRDHKVQAILHAYLQAVDAGQLPDREEIVRQHPPFATQLREFFADQAKMDSMARSLRQSHALEGAITLPASEAAQAVVPPAPESGDKDLPHRVRYFGDYELQEEIARGGMGVVFKAKQLSLNRPVALKMILQRALANEADVQRFRDEAEAAANLDHPNIVPIYEIGEHEGQHYFSMKLISPGKRREDWSVPEAVRITALVARAVHHAHQRGILHRDLKPGNILFDESGSPHVADFGLAKRVGGDSGMTRTGAIVGTPSYMAPEQARAEKVLTTAVDVYSLGAILYEWLTGQPPFRGNDVLATVLMVKSDEPPRPRTLNPRIDRDLETICLKCLAKEPARRYGSAEMLAEDLERWLRGEPIAARPVRAAERMWRWCRRNPTLAATTALAAIALAATVCIAVVAVIRERDNAALIAQQERDSALQKQEHEQREREKDRERLRDSYIEQARAERLAGNRARSLYALRKAADIRRDDDLRLEASATITRAGLHFLGALPYQQPNELHLTASSDGELVALPWKRDMPEIGMQDRIEVREIRSGKLLGSKKGRYFAGAFRPGTAQLALVPYNPLSNVASNVVLWDPKTDQETGKFEVEDSLWDDDQGRAGTGFSGPVRTAFSTDGSHLLAESQMYGKTRGRRVWNLTKKRKVNVPKKGKFLGFLSEHELLLLDEDRYRVWDCRIQQENSLTPQGLKAVGFSASARLAALRGRLADDPAETLYIWDLATGKRVGAIPSPGEIPSFVDFSPNGRYAVCQFAADQAKSLRVWDMHRRSFSNRLNVPRGLSLSTEWPGDDRFVYRSFNPDGSLFATLVQAGDARSWASLCIWDMSTGDILSKLPAFPLYWWSSDGHRLMLRDSRSIHSCEVTRPLPSYQLESAVKSLSLNKNGDRLAVNHFVCKVVEGDRGPELAAWEATPDGLIPHFVGKDEIWAVRVERDNGEKSASENRLLDVTVFAASIVGLLSSPQGAGLNLARSQLFPRTFELFPDNTTHRTELLQLSPQQRRIVLPNDYPEYAEWALIKARHQENLNTYDSIRTYHWAMAPDAPLFLHQGTVEFRRVLQPWQPYFSVGRNGTPVRDLWNYQEGKRVAVLGSNSLWFALGFSPDGSRFFTLENPRRGLEIWNTVSCKVERVLERFISVLEKPIFSSDSRRLLAKYRTSEGSKYEERAGLFDVNDGQEVQSWKVELGDWQVFALSPDGALAASGGQDMMVHLWEVATGRELGRWQGHDGYLTALLFSRDGRTLYSGGQDGTLKLWSLPFLRSELKNLNLDW